MTHRALSELQSDIAFGVAILADVVTDLADAGRVEDLAGLLADRVPVVSAETALRILNETAEPPVALLCRAAGLSVNGYSAILRLRCRRRPGATHDPTALLSAYIPLGKVAPKQIMKVLQAHARELELNG